MGGEKPFLFYGGSSDSGSPPRGRGKAACHSALCPRRRITPAWAGKRFCKEIAPPSVEDHPRMGGEKILEPSMGVGNFGSPPRGRGKAEPVAAGNCLPGIIPAWAGKRYATELADHEKRNHPRVGGEKVRLRWKPKSKKGSPPHGRGKGLRQLSGVAHHRSTPAWAGKSLPVLLRSHSGRDHPRVGGEKHTPGRKASREQGSPPRRRGKGQWTLCPQLLPGITPA